MSALKDEMLTGPLSPEIEPFLAAGDDASISGILNRADIPALGIVKSNDISAYLALCGLLLQITESKTTACKSAVLSLGTFDELDYSNPEVYSLLSETIDDLVKDVLLIPRFTEENKAYILAMGNKFISRCQEIDISATPIDVRREIWADDGTRLM